MSTQPGVKKLSILIPVFNEVRTLAFALERVAAVELPCEREIIIVDDGSGDGSWEIIESFAERHDCARAFRHSVNRGKGAAIRTAIAEITGDWAIIQDADLEYDPADYAQLLVPAMEGIADAVFGSRFLVGRYARALFFWHSLANKLLTLATNVLNDLNLSDMETCLKLMRADMLRDLVLTGDRFEIEPELTTKLARWGARIYEAPISYRGRTYAEGKKIGARDALQAAWALIYYRFLDGSYTRNLEFMHLQALRKARWLNRWSYAQIVSFLGSQVLEVGSGLGAMSERVLDRRRLVCVDDTPMLVERLWQTYGHLANVTVVQGDAICLSENAEVMAGGAFDTVLCQNVLEHVEDDMAVLGEFQKVLLPGGIVALFVPNNPAAYGSLDRSLGHLRRYTVEEVARKLTEAGFTVLACHGFNRLGGLGWRVANGFGEKAYLRLGLCTSLFSWLAPVARLLDAVPFHPPNTIVAIARKK